jgi:L-fuculose-phosphate aldolase
VAPYARPGSDALAAGVSAAAADGAVVLLANHGSVVAAPSLLGAIDLSEELEAAAMVDFLTLGRPRMPLSDRDLGELRRA